MHRAPSIRMIQWHLLQVFYQFMLFTTKEVCWMLGESQFCAFDTSSLGISLSERALGRGVRLVPLCQYTSLPALRLTYIRSCRACMPLIQCLCDQRPNIIYSCGVGCHLIRSCNPGGPVEGGTDVAHSLNLRRSEGARKMTDKKGMK